MVRATRVSVSDDVLCLTSPSGNIACFNTMTACDIQDSSLTMDQ